jgi:uncharacterized protein DUF1707
MSAGGDEVRVSDDDRDAAAAILGAHWEAGRLGLSELEQRVDAVYAATTRAELDRALRELPAGPPAAATQPSARGRRRVFLPGRFDFRETVEVGAPPERAHDEALASIAPALGRAGYHLVASERPTMLRFAHRSGLLNRHEHPLTMLFLPGRNAGTRIVAFGEAPRAVRKAFAELRD